MPGTRTGAVARRHPLRPTLLEVRVSPAAVVAALAVVLTAVRFEVHLSITLGTLLGVALAPVWIGSLRRFRGASLLMGLGAAALVAGVWLTEVSAADRRTSDRLLLVSVVLVLNLLVGTGVLLWARTLLPDALVAVLYGVGMLAGISGEGRFAENPWRFGFSVPLTVLLLGLTWYLRRKWLGVAAALALGAVSALNDGRSTFAMLVLTAVLVAWRAGPRPTSGRRRSTLRSMSLVLALGFAVYNLGQGLILDGYLGESTQQRTAAQMATSGSLILGARPELGATSALVQARPQGYGAGTLPSAQDVTLAKAGMADLGYDPNNGYVENYMFGSGFELHSMLGDLWAGYGLVGVALCALMAWQVGRHFADSVGSRSLNALMTFLVIRTAWNLLFSPLNSSVTLMVLTLGLALAVYDPVRSSRRAGADVRAYSA
ncbi:hypothetical protein [Actinotalea subterranea]|uniref:hypothetical protein n=1 Tax=Actinotalea subterranea TaxID=2607497 RepID=UPI0011EF0C60|nr:hypothetical protein [Actinotalea subterranea]